MPVVRLPEAARKKDRKCERYKYFFFSDEGNEPPHIHVESSDGLAKFWLTPEVSLVWKHRFNDAEINQIRRCITLHKKLFIRQFNEHLKREE